MPAFRLPLLPPSRLLRRSLPRAPTPTRFYSSPSTPLTSPFAPRHLLSIADLTSPELTTLIRRAAAYKSAILSGSTPPSLHNALLNQTVAILMSKRSTRTRVSLEAAVARMGGHPMFLGAGDIQLGVNESVYDTSVVLSSMVAGVVARVHAHADVAQMAKHSSVPVINGLSDSFHPLQALADLLTLYETFGRGGASTDPSSSSSASSTDIDLSHLKLAWIGDANNVLFDLAIACAKLGIRLAVASPPGYTIPEPMLQTISSYNPSTSTSLLLSQTSSPLEAAEEADVIFTDTWVSMGQEDDKAKRLRDFAGFQVTEELGKQARAKADWRFMHCLPRHQEEVSDEVFYGPRSLVWREAQNRLWTAIVVLEAFVANGGKIAEDEARVRG